MRLRIKNKWNNKEREHSIEEVGSVLAFNIWRIAGANVLHLENEGFQTDTYHQRLDVVAEISSFLVHVIDRMLMENAYEQEDRRELITALALNLAKTMHDNRRDVSEGDAKEQDYKGAFIELLNTRMSEYSGYSFDEGEPGFQLKRRVGDHVMQNMGEKDRKWIQDQVIEIEIPDALKTLYKVTRNMI